MDSAQHTRRKEPGRRAVDVRIPAHQLLRHVVLERRDQVELVPGPRHGDIQEPPLFLDQLWLTGRELGGESPVGDVQDRNAIPFLAFGRVNRRKNEIVFVEQGRT